MADQQHIRDHLAEVALAIRYEDIPASVIAEAKRLVLDTLSGVYGGWEGGPTKGVRSIVRALGGTPEATVLGTEERTNALLACLANGTSLRFIDANDYYFGRDPSHASGNLAPALAMAQKHGLGGKGVILGLAVGYEVQFRLVDHAGEPSLWDRGWHHGTNMAIASAALSGRLMGLDRTAIANAIAIAASHNNTLTESMRGTMATMKATVEAVTAKAGIEAVLLAAEGITGPETAFEGISGWGKVVAGSMNVEGLTEPFDGSRYRLMDTCMKPFAAHALSQANIEAAILLSRDDKVPLDEIESIRVHYSRPVLNSPVMDPAKFGEPKNKETADHSPPYLIAVAMLEHDCGPAQFMPDKLASPRIRSLMAKVSVAHDPQLDTLYPGSLGGRVVVTLKSGAVRERFCPAPPGHPKNRIDDARLQHKFRTYSEPTLGREGVDRVIEATMRLDRIDDLADYADALVIRR